MFFRANNLAIFPVKIIWQTIKFLYLYGASIAKSHVNPKKKKKRVGFNSQRMMLVLIGIGWGDAAQLLENSGEGGERNIEQERESVRGCFGPLIFAPLESV